MPDIEYKIYYNSEPATQAQLDRVESITVEQEVDMAWEARLEIPLCLDADGTWSSEDENLISSFTRIRVEIRIGAGDFTPLIDGPIVGHDSSMSSEPGQSSVTLLVHDDSVYLNREERQHRFENRLDHEIAGELFRQFEQIGSTDVETTPAPSGDLTPQVAQRGTAMQLLRTLARRNGKHAYVLPGNDPGESMGCFKDFPTETNGLPAMVLLGSERNVSNFTVRRDAQSPSVVHAATVRVTDKSTITRTASFRDRELLGDAAALEDEGESSTQQLTPRHGDSADLDQAVTAEAERSGYAMEATGQVIMGCYTGVLAPYRLVTVRAGETPLSGDYLIMQVTHELTRSIYNQSFTARRNARSSISSGGLGDLAGSIF